jgi:hypothetical protein
MINERLSINHNYSVKKDGMKSLKHTKANWPITLQELIDRRDQCKKIESRWSIISLIVLVGFVFALMPFTKWFVHNVDVPKWVMTVLIIVFLVSLVSYLPLFLYAFKKLLKTFDLVCPSCSKEIAVNLMPITVATGHCGNCGALLVSNHPSKTEPKGGVGPFSAASRP